MGRKAFQAEMWLLKHSANVEHVDQTMSAYSTGLPNLPTFKEKIPPLPIKQEGFTPANCFIPGWSGDSLISKHIQKFQNKLSKVHQDAKERFLLHSNFNRTLKQNIFQDFLSFLEHKAINSVQIDDYQYFWNELNNPLGAHKEVIDQFINIYSFRVATIYMLKLRFIKHLQDQISPEFDIKYAYYPSAFLTSLFRRGSSFELKSKALESNIYSWYRPSEYLSKEISELCSFIAKIDVAELVKVISVSFYQLIQQQAPFSHALSHKNFGLFLNSLLINFPLWLKTSHKGEETHYQDNSPIEVVSCKFDGDYLESLSLSHWLAQQSNQAIRWEQILCPDFKGQEFDSGLFLKISNELQLLTILIDIAKSQQKPVIQFLCNIMNGHLQNKKDSPQAQKTLCLNDLSLNKSTYDRVVLNISNYPKNNSQHYLIGQVQNQLDVLKEDGMLFVISSKKLFVPSQKTKVDALLEKLNVEAIFDLNDIKGKGEVGNYIYIFTKPKNFQFHQQHEQNKQSCYTFRFSGELSTFQEFSEFTDLLHTFFINHLKEVIPMYQKETDKGLRFEFFQDAIVDGRLIHSSSKDSSKITHPHFFKSLMQSYVPFDHCFDLQNIESENDYANFDEPPLFPLGEFAQQTSYPYIVIVDKRESNHTVLEIIHQKAYDAKSYQYGHTQCFYFGLRSKWPNICLNSLQEFFNTKIGRQIIDLTFNSENRKIKSRLSKMLVPKFLIDDENLPGHIRQGIGLLYSSEDTIMDLHPSELKNHYEQIQQFAMTLSKNYPASILSALANFKRSLQNCLDNYGMNKRSTKINFNNPMLKTPLLLAKTYPIYPNNQDVYIEFKLNNANILHTELTSFRSFHTQDNGTDSYGINLFAKDQIVLAIYSDKDMINFIEFLLSKVIGVAISSIIQGIAVPRLTDLKNIIQGHQRMNDGLTKVYESIDPLIDTITNQSAFQQ